MILFKLKKIHSGALQFTVFVSVVIALILMGIILLAYSNRFFQQQSEITVNNITLANEAINTLCNKDQNTTDTTEIKLSGTVPGQQIKASVSMWGVFEKAGVNVVYKNRQYKKLALLGALISQDSRPALYLTERYKPLSVVGNTKIDGLCYLPAQGVRPGNIAGNSYYGKELVNGEVRTSTDSLPTLKYNVYNNLNGYFNYQPNAESEFIPLQRGTKTEVSFEGQTKGYFSEGKIILENVHLRGNIIIRSAEEIVITNSAILHDIILIAPIIRVESGTSGNFQAIADKSIVVKQNCNLTYPTALILLKKPLNQQAGITPEANKVEVEKGCKISGIILYLTNEKEENYINNIQIAETVKLKGEIYCEGNLEIRGTIDGSVFTNQILTNEGGTTFVNHLYNTEINIPALHNTYAGLLFKNSSKTVAKWLY